MFKKKLYILFFLIFAIVFVIYTENSIKEGFLKKSIAAKNSFFLYFDKLNDLYDRYFNQSEAIKRLQNSMQDIEALIYLNSAYKDEIDRLSKLLELKTFDPKVKFVRVISYANLKDYSEVWIDFDEFNSSKIYGLIRDTYTAGIVISRHKLPLGILQNSKNCTFAVAIGKDKIPGIIFGGEEFMTIKFIPPWRNPTIGDEVITSGLDKIFYPGIKVGKIIELKSEESYKIAVVKPYVSDSVPNFFHIVKKVK